jgi:hypothetical protein
MKTKTMTVTRRVGSRFDRDARQYVEHIYFEVIQITDSIQHIPGARLEPEIVEALCDAEDWKVTVKGDRL